MLLVLGIAASSTLDGHNDVLLWSDLVASFERAIRFPPLSVYVGHQAGHCVGQVLKIQPDQSSQEIRAILEIYNAGAAARVKAGTLKGISICASGRIRRGLSFNIVSCGRALELSLVDDPANDRCRILAWSDPASGERWQANEVRPPQPSEPRGGFMPKGLRFEVRPPRGTSGR